MDEEEAAAAAAAADDDDDDDDDDDRPSPQAAVDAMRAKLRFTPSSTICHFSTAMSCRRPLHADITTQQFTMYICHHNKLELCHSNTTESAFPSPHTTINPMTTLSRPPNHQRNQSDTIRLMHWLHLK